MGSSLQPLFRPLDDAHKVFTYTVMHAYLHLVSNKNGTGRRCTVCLVHFGCGRSVI